MPYKQNFIEGVVQEFDNYKKEHDISPDQQAQKVQQLLEDYLLEKGKLIALEKKRDGKINSSSAKEQLTNASIIDAKKQGSFNELKKAVREWDQMKKDPAKLEMTQKLAQEEQRVRETSLVLEKDRRKAGLSTTHDRKQSESSEADVKPRKKSMEGLSAAADSTNNKIKGLFKR